MRRLQVLAVVAAHLLVLLHGFVPHSHAPGASPQSLLARALSLVGHTAAGEAFRVDDVQAQALRQVPPTAPPHRKPRLLWPPLSMGNPSADPRITPPSAVAVPRAHTLRGPPARA